MLFLIVMNTFIGLAEISFKMFALQFIEFYLAGRVWMANGKWWCWCRGLQQW